MSLFVKKLINGVQTACTQFVSYPNAKYLKMMVYRDNAAMVATEFIGLSLMSYKRHLIIWMNKVSYCLAFPVPDRERIKGNDIWGTCALSTIRSFMYIGNIQEGMKSNTAGLGNILVNS